MLTQEKQAIVKSVHEEIAAILREKGSTTTTINAHDELNAHLGLESLDLAELVTSLEIRLDADPFASHTPITRIRSVGDLINAYSSFLLEGEPAEDDEANSALQAAQNRANARRRR